jgi:hypothetical protein
VGPADKARVETLGAVADVGFLSSALVAAEVARSTLQEVLEDPVSVELVEREVARRPVAAVVELVQEAQEELAREPPVEMGELQWPTQVVVAVAEEPVL